MDTTLVSLLTDYTRKTASLMADVKSCFADADACIERRDRKKTASFSSIKERALRTAYAMGNTRFANGQPLISGPEQIKVAAARLESHESTIDMIHLLLNSINTMSSKTAYVEPGQPAAGSTASTLSSKQEFYQDVMGKSPV